MNDEQIKEVMRRADEIADYAWKEGLSDGAYSNAKQDRECRAESRKELESYLRTIGEPAGNDLRWAAEVVEKYDDATAEACYMIDSTDCAAILTALAEYKERFDAPTPKRSEPESVNAELLDALKRVSSTLETIGDLPSMKADVDAAIARAESAIETPAKVSPCAGHAVQQEADEAGGA